MLALQQTSESPKLNLSSQPPTPRLKPPLLPPNRKWASLSSLSNQEQRILASAAERHGAEVRIQVRRETDDEIVPFIKGLSMPLLQRPRSAENIITMNSLFCVVPRTDKASLWQRSCVSPMPVSWISREVVVSKRILLTYDPTRAIFQPMAG